MREHNRGGEGDYHSRSDRLSRVVIVCELAYYHKVLQQVWLRVDGVKVGCSYWTQSSASNHDEGNSSVLLRHVVARHHRGDEVVHLEMRSLEAGWLWQVVTDVLNLRYQSCINQSLNTIQFDLKTKLLYTYVVQSSRCFLTDVDKEDDVKLIHRRYGSCQMIFRWRWHDGLRCRRYYWQRPSRNSSWLRCRTNWSR